MVNREEKKINTIILEQFHDPKPRKTQLCMLRCEIEF